jgi:uncharacterized RDD family membrane protein YckC/DNA-directed RNA polymerase subunit RPC12/RpoP
VIEKNLASLWSRTGGALIDTILVIVISTTCGFIWINFIDVNHADTLPTDEAKFILIGLIVDLIYTVVTMTGSKQSTYGQRAVGIKIVKDSGEAVDLSTAVARYLVSLVSSIFLKLGFLIAIFTKDKKTLHDLVCGTIVIIIKEEKEKIDRQTLSTQANASSEKLKKDLNIKEEEIWEKVYKEFNTEERKKGIWAQLYVEHNGNEDQAKVAYIRKRVEQLKELAKNEREIVDYNSKKNRHIKDETIRQLVSNEYESLIHWDTKYFALENGEFALPSNPFAANYDPGKYRIYIDKVSVIETIEGAKTRVNNLGFIRTVEVSRFMKPIGNKVITCRKCKKEITVKNETGTVKCSSCFHKWLYEVEPI